MITFIDTPGHAAFTAMRARGAKVTDIVVLVVAADDGVMPQTIEAINHAKAAGVPIIVAINKIDKPDAKPRARAQELLQYEVQVESSAATRSKSRSRRRKQTNLDKLLEAIALQAEVLDLDADPDRPPKARSSRRGSTAAAARSPPCWCSAARCTSATSSSPARNGAACARCIDDKGENVPRRRPSTPVEVLGFSGAPEAGDRVAVVENEARAREITEYRERQKREKLRPRAAASRAPRSST